MSNLQSVEMLKTAIVMEEKGYAFYKKATAECDNELGLQIFTTLMNDELVHIQRIKNIYTALTGNQPWDDKWKEMKEDHSNLCVMFKELAKKQGKDVRANASDIKALEVGIDFEQKSIEFYNQHLKKAKDPVEKKFLERMVEEETEHHHVLRDLKLYLEDPSAYFIEVEKHNLDGA